jgi:hypothetical protein
MRKYVNEALEDEEEYDSTADTLNHIYRVRQLLNEVRDHLYLRGLDHDRSKLEEPEKSAFDQLGQRQRGIKYGTPEYFAQFEYPGMKEAIQHHYYVNSHHPESHVMSTPEDLNKAEVLDGTAVSRMTLLDVCEMVADWRAASERYREGSIADSLEHNRVRFGLSDQLYAILVNTVEELGW